MYAVQIKENGKLIWEKTEDPILKNGEALIEVKAVGVNRADILQRKGLYPPPKGASEILGLELSGRILELKGNSKWQIDDNIMILVGGGAYATKAAVPIDMLLPVPSTYGYEEAAAIPESLYTSYLNLIIEGELKKNETVLIHSAAGGIGSTAIQLAKSTGAKVVATCGSEEKIKFCRSLGADFVVNYKEADFENNLKEIQPEGFDLIFDTVGSNEYAKMHVNLLKPNGRWILIGLLGGIKAEINFADLLRKNILLKGSTLRNKPLAFKINLTNHIAKTFLPLYELGKMKSVISKVFPIQEAEAAHQYMLENKVKGKIVLKA